MKVGRAARRVPTDPHYDNVWDRWHHRLIYGLLVLLLVLVTVDSLAHHTALELSLDVVLVLIVGSLGVVQSALVRRERRRLLDALDVSVGVARRANTTASNAELERDQLYGAMLHTFKTPLTTIRANAELLGDSRFSAEAHARQREAIIDASVELDYAINRGTATFRTVSEAWNVETRVMPDLDAYIGLLIESQQSWLPRLRYTTPPFQSPVPVKVDVQALKIIMHHLVENALKYSPANTPIEVETQATDYHATISVTSATFPEQEELTNEIFRPFRRKSTLDGSGLGLYVCENLTRAMLGGIEVQHNARQGRVCFHVLLPRANCWEPLAALAEELNH